MQAFIVDIDETFVMTDPNDESAVLATNIVKQFLVIQARIPDKTQIMLRIQLASCADSGLKFSVFTEKLTGIGEPLAEGQYWFGELDHTGGEDWAAPGQAP